MAVAKSRGDLALHDCAAARKAAHDTVTGGPVQHCRRRHLPHASFFHHRDAIRDRERLRLIMRDIDESGVGKTAKACDLSKHASA